MEVIKMPYVPKPVEGPFVNANLVKTLEKMLEDAKCGLFLSMAAVMAMEGKIGAAIALANVERDGLVILGGLEMIKDDVKRVWREEGK
jgi:hypothetical protein